MIARALAALLILAPCAGLAQSITGGYAVDALGGGPLGCIDVALEDSAGVEVATTRTLPNGAFQFVTPDSGTYGFRFALDGFAPLRTPPSRLSRTEDDLREYRLVFDTRTPPAKRPRKTDAESPVWPDYAPRAGPRYPAELRDRGVEGEVLAQFIVDERGRAQLSSVRTLRSRDPAFTRAVLDFLPRARYWPARRAGQAVCSMVEQRFVFQLNYATEPPPTPMPPTRPPPASPRP